jgi:formylglycine-generating enzyme required for sulfatase activity
LLDGSARFISDTVNPAVWHVIHSRDTPRELLAGGLEAVVADFAVVPDQPAPAVMPPPPNLPPLSTMVNSIGMEFVLIPAGEYLMGLPDNGNGHDIPEEAPPHSVRLTRRFLIGRHEVTREQYAHVMGRSAAPSSMEEAADEPGRERFPATQVTWQDADTFCQLLSNLPAERAVGHRYRLPTEAEWEYACRAGRESPFDWSASRGAGDVSGNAAGILPPLPLCEVGSFPPNGFGLYDMRGNAWEWCADWFDRSYYRRSPRNDPRGPQRGFIKVVRGGDWTFVGEGCKISYAMMPPWKSSPFVGFRVVCEVEEQRANSTSQTGSL